MSIRSLSLKVKLSSALVLVGLVAAACSPAPTAVVTQRPPATLAPTKVVASPAPTKASASATAPAATQATAAPTQAATKAAPTAAAPTATQLAIDTPLATELSQPVPVPVGQQQQTGNLAIVVVKVEQQNAVGTLQPQTGHHFELVTVTAENTGATGAVHFLPEDFALYDTLHENSYVSDPASAVRTMPDALPSGDIQPGKSVTGVIVYEVPDTATKWELKYQTLSADLLWTLSG